MIIFNTYELLGSLGLFILAVFGRSAGLGGGTISIAIMILVFGMDNFNSIGFTQLYLSTGTLTVLLIRYGTRHPRKDQPIYYYDLLIQVLSPILLGISIGSHVVPSFPTWFTLVVYTLVNAILCSYVVYHLFKYIKNNKSLKNPQKANSIVVVETHELENLYHINSARSLNPHRSEDLNNVQISNHFSIQNNQNKENNKDLINFNYYLLQNKKVISTIHLGYFALVMVVSVLLSNMAYSPSVIQVSKCSFYYPVIIAIYSGFVIIVNGYTSYYLVDKTNVFIKFNYEFELYEIKWTYAICLKVWLLGLLFGIFLGLSGLGTGYAVSVYLLYIGVTPDISSVTNFFAILFTSTVSAIQFYISGNLDYRYGLWFAGIAIVSSSIGTLFAKPYFVKKCGLWIIILITEGILFTSFIVGGIVIVRDLYNQRSNFILGFQSLC